MLQYVFAVRNDTQIDNGAASKVRDLSLKSVPRSVIESVEYLVELAVSNKNMKEFLQALSIAGCFNAYSPLNIYVLAFMMVQRED